MGTQKLDLAFGLKNEHTVLESIEGMVGTKLNHHRDYSVMDYSNESKTIYVELKSRRIRHNAYDTALIGRNKIQYCTDPNKAYYFVFSYTDGLYYIKYDRVLFNTFRTDNEYYRTERGDCKNNAQSIIHIPVKHLLKI